MRFAGNSSQCINRRPFNDTAATAPCNDVDPRGLALGPAAFDASLSLQAGLQNKHYPFLIGSGPTSLQDAVFTKGLPLFTRLPRRLIPGHSEGYKTGKEPNIDKP